LQDEMPDRLLGRERDRNAGSKRFRPMSTMPRWVTRAGEGIGRQGVVDEARFGRRAARSHSRGSWSATRRCPSAVTRESDRPVRAASRHCRGNRAPPAVCARRHVPDDHAPPSAVSSTTSSASGKPATAAAPWRKRSGNTASRVRDIEQRDDAA